MLFTSMLFAFSAVALAVPAPPTHLAVCDSGGIAYLGTVGPGGLERATWDGTQGQLDRLLALAWTSEGEAVSLRPARLSILEADFQINALAPSDERAREMSGLQILLGPCANPGVVYVDQPWARVDALPTHRVALLEPSAGKPVLEVNGQRYPLGTWWDEGHSVMQPRVRELQLLQQGDHGLVVAPVRGPFASGWKVVYLGETVWTQQVETENSWD